MASPLVSIIIPVYNSENFLKETIESAIGQTWSNKEILIIDDGSTDNSLAIARKFESSQVKVFSQQNKGASAARNKGLLEARGDYIQFLDADDLLSPDKISRQIDILEKKPGMVSISSTIHFKGTLTDAGEPSVYEEAFICDDDDPVHFLVNLWGGYSKHGSMITVHSWLTPRNIVDKAGLWNENLSLDDDGEYFCRVVLSSAGIVKAPGFNYYRKHSDLKSQSSQNDLRGLKSSLLSAQLKKKYLLERTDSYAAKLATYKILMHILVASYLLYPAIYKTAKSELPDISPGPYRPPMGGPLSDFLTRILGWRLIKFIKIKLRYFYK